MFEPPVAGNLKPSGDVKMEPRLRSRYRSPPKTRTEGGRGRMQCRGAFVSRRTLTESGRINYKTEGMILFERFSHHILLLKLFGQVQNKKDFLYFSVQLDEFISIFNCPYVRMIRSLMSDQQIVVLQCVNFFL